MARKRALKFAKLTQKRTVGQTVHTSRSKKNLFDRLQSDLQNNQSYLNLILGGLIVLVLGALLFNYFNKLNNPENLTPAQQTENTQNEDVNKNSLPGKYTVKEGDTLFDIAQKYYNDGYKYTEIANTNKLENADALNAGQVLEIPKLTANAAPAASVEPQSNPTQPVQGGTGGAENQTIWGEKITADTYTVQEGDWLSKIAGRAYGDIMAYTKIAQANNINNPDLIEPGMTLKLPR